MGWTPKLLLSNRTILRNLRDHLAQYVYCLAGKLRPSSTKTECPFPIRQLGASQSCAVSFLWGSLGTRPHTGALSSEGFICVAARGLSLINSQ